MNPVNRPTADRQIDSSEHDLGYSADGGTKNRPDAKPISSREAEALASFAFELGNMKRIRRTGWWHAGVESPESIADHSLRVAQLAGLIASMEGGCSARASMLGLWHDSQETRTGDLPHTARPYVAVDSCAISRNQTAQLPARAARIVMDAVEEYESQISPESLCASDADKLDCFLQAVEYRHAGYRDVESWLKSSRRSFRLATTHEMATAALATSPTRWRDAWIG